MVQVLSVLLGISIILIMGSIAEFLFKKIHIPDILFLMILGFAIGPFGLNYIQPSQISEYAPIFTTFALLFLLYDGAFNISLKSLLKGAIPSLNVTLFNFIISTIVVGGIMLAFSFDFMTSLLTGFILGGISSAFVIPVLKQLDIKGDTYFILTFESAITDVLCIVSAFTVMEIITIQSFSIQIVLSKIASLFAVAGLVGILAGILWIFLVAKVFKEYKSYMLTIAYLILVYAVTEFLNGNGAIAGLFFGLVLKNSKDLTEIFSEIMNSKKGDPHKKNKVQSSGIAVTNDTEEFFYSQISFFLKTFFFVYIGILLDPSQWMVLIIAGCIALALMFSRITSNYVTKNIDRNGRILIRSIFARGLAAAAIAQVLVINNIEYATVISKIVYGVIFFTILLSSITLFFIKKTNYYQKSAHLHA